MKIVFLDESTITLGDIDFSKIKKTGDYYGFANSAEDEIIARADQAAVIIVNKTPMTKDVIRSLPDLKFISVIASGYNNIDTQAAKHCGIQVSNVAGYASNTVPQHTFSLILNLATQTYRYFDDVRRGDWEKASSFTLLKYPTFELAGKVIGIIGFGAIGQGVARIAEGFGMHVIFNDAYCTHDKYHNTELRVLMETADIVTVHCPLTDKTHHLIDSAMIEKMKPSAILINTARGGIVDEEALAKALNSGRIAGAGIDVLTQEPPVGRNPLFDARNIVITPHSAWSTVEARQTLVDETADNINAFLRGRPQNLVVS